MAYATGGVRLFAWRMTPVSAATASAAGVGPVCCCCWACEDEPLPPAWKASSSAVIPRDDIDRLEGGGCGMIHDPPRVSTGTRCRQVERVA